MCVLMFDFLLLERAMGAWVPCGWLLCCKMCSLSARGFSGFSVDSCSGFFGTLSFLFPVNCRILLLRCSTYGQLLILFIVYTCVCVYVSSSQKEVEGQVLEPGKALYYTWAEPTGSRELCWNCGSYSGSLKNEEVTDPSWARIL